MCGYDIEAVLETFRVVADKREQLTLRARERFSEFGDSLERGTLDYGDYCANATMLSGAVLYDLEHRIRPACAIERKMDLDELAQSLTRNRDRFERELERASAHGAKVYLMVEDGSYEAILRHRYCSRLSPKAFMASLIAWQARYDLTVVFCKRETAGLLIREILRRDLRERLTRGQFDDLQDPADI